MTGSFLLASREGISPAISVKHIEIAMRMSAPCHGSAATLDMPASEWIIRLIGMSRSIVTQIPITPAAKPMMSVSALNTRDTSRLDAPRARRTPISLILSRTEI